MVKLGLLKLERFDKYLKVKSLHAMSFHVCFIVNSCIHLIYSLTLLEKAFLFYAIIELKLCLLLDCASWGACCICPLYNCMLWFKSLFFFIYKNGIAVKSWILMRLFTMPCTGAHKDSWINQECQFLTFCNLSFCLCIIL